MERQHYYSGVSLSCSDVENYIDSHDNLDLHSTRKVRLPKPEMFVIYTGEKKDVKDVVTYSGEFLDGEESNIDVRIRVIRDGKEGDIINQYVRFTRVLTEQVKRYGRTRQAVVKTIDICKNQDVLKEYLQSREEEVVSIMVALYDFNNSLDKKIKQERFEARNEGRMEGEETQAKKTAAKLYMRGNDPADIADIVGYAADTVKKWLGILPD